jgi:hypothetical protein
MPNRQGQTAGGFESGGQALSGQALTGPPTAPVET